MKLKRNSIMTLFKNNIALLLLIVACLFITSISRTIGAQYVENITDHIQTNGLTGLWVPLLIACAAQFGHYSTKYITAVSCQSLNTKLRRDLRIRFMRHLQSIPLAMFEKRQPGQYLSILKNDADSAAYYIYIVFSRIGMSVFTAFFTFFAMLRINVALSFVILAVTLGFGFINNFILKRIKRNEADARAAQEDITNAVLTGFSAADSIKTYRAQDFMRSLYFRFRRRYSRALMNVQKIDGTRLGLYTVVNNVTLYGSILFLAWRALRGENTLGEALAYNMLLTQVLVSIEMIFRWSGAVVKSNASWERMEQALGDGGEQAEEAATETYPVESFAADGLSYSYEEGAPVFSGLSISMERGGIYGLSGESGSGKSTLLKCLLGLYESPGAAFTVNSSPRTREDIRHLFSFVPSEHFLFSGTVYENITLGNEAVTREECLSRAETLGSTQWIKALPEGIDTEIETGGANLSGGQRQMLCILRAILSGRPILVLDEPFSALDQERAANLTSALETIRQDRIILLTTHRSNTIGICDRVYAL